MINDSSETRIVTKRQLTLLKAALKRALKRGKAYRRRLRPGRYSLRQWNRMRALRFNPAFLFPIDMPVGLKVLIVLPHHHEAAKIGGLVRMLTARESGEAGPPRNRVHAVVVMPSYRGIREVELFSKREHMIDAVNKEALDWAHLIGLDLGIPPWDSSRRLKNPATELPPHSAYVCRRFGDEFAYGPDKAYRFFNAWRTYDSGERDPNQQQVDAEDQRAFNALIREEAPDIVLLPDQLDSHPSHRTTREITMEALRSFLAEQDSRGVKQRILLLEYASFHLLTPPRYNLWAVAPKELTRVKAEANKVFRLLQRLHDYEMDQMMAERVASLAAGDEFAFTQKHREKVGFNGRLSPDAPDELPANVTAENYTASLLGVATRQGVPVVRETRVSNPLSLLKPPAPGRAPEESRIGDDHG